MTRAFSRRFIAIAVAAAALLGAGRSARAATVTWDPGGGGDRSWSTPGNWSTGMVPGFADDVVFDGSVANNRAEIDTSIDVNSITTLSGFSRNVSFTGSVVNTIRVRTNITLNGSGDFECSTGTTQIDGTLSMPVGSGSFSANGGDVTISGSINQSDGTINNLTGSLLVGGGLTEAGGTLNAGAAGTILITGNVSASIGTINANSGTFTIGGNLSLTGGTFDAGTGPVNIVGSVTQSSGGFTSGSGAITIGSNVSVSGATFAASSGTMTIGGNLGVTGGTFNGGSGLLIISGSVNPFSAGTFRASSTNTRIGGAFVDTGGTYNDNNGNMLFTSKTNQAHTFGGSIFRKTTFNDGMVGYWNLDENTGTTINDLSGFTNTGTSSNLTWATASPPSLAFTDTSYGTFNGSSSRIALTVSQLPAANAAQSIAAWVNINALPGSASTIVSLTGTSSAVKLGLSPTALRVLRNDGTALITGAAPSLGSWHHVAYTWNGSSNNLFVDGVLLTAATATAHDGAAVAAGFIGATSAAADFFNGSIDEVRIYDRALTPAEVSALALGNSPQTSIATHTLTDAYTASVGANVADMVIVSGTVTGSSAISIEGSWLNYGGRFTGTGTVTLTSNAAEALRSGGSSFAALTINRGSANYTLRDRLWIPGGTFTLTTGRIQLASYTMHVGSMTLTAGTFTVGTGTVVLDGTSSQTLPGSILTSYNGLRLEDPTETSLVGYWKLDEGAGPSTRDWSGTGNTGTLASTGATWTGPSASVGFDNASAMTFGSSGYVSAGTTSLPAANAAQTISGWVNITALPGSASSIVALTGASSAVKLGLSATNLRVLRNDGTALIQTTAPSTGTWHHVAYTWDGTNNNLYVDGTAVTSTATSHDGAAVTGAFIGATSAAADFFNGKIDDVRVYNAALTATQIARLAGGRYAGTGGIATVTLGANTTVAGTFALDSANLSSNTFTMNHSLTTAVAAINSGTYTVGTLAQQFQGGLTVRSGGTLTMATSGGSVQIATGKTLTMDGTLNGSTTGAIIRSVSGTFGFSIGSTASARPTLNITGLTVQSTDASGMRINVDPAAITTFTRFDNLVFLTGTTTYLNIYATALYLNSSGTRFGITTGGVSDATLPTNNVTLTGNGTGDGETRIMFGTATCAAAKTTAGYCQDAWTSDGDANNDGIADTPVVSGGSVVQYVRSISTDTAGNIEGLPTAAFDWNTFTYYSTYVAFHDASGTADRVYVRDQTGTPKYQWDTPSGETIVGTPRWNTTGTSHYLYVALASGKVYRLIDNGTSLVADTSTNWAGALNPFDCACTIVSPLAMDTTNLYFGGTRAGPTQMVWTLGQASRAQPTGSPFTITPVITSSAPALWTSGATTYLFMGLVGNIIKFNATTQMIDSTNTNPGAAAIYGRVLPSTTLGTVFAGDSGGTMWAINATTFGGTNKTWSYVVASDSIRSSPYVDASATTAAGTYFGTEGGKVLGLNNTTGAPLTGYPTNPDGATDPIRTAPLYTGGLLIVGNTTGKLFFIDRSTGLLYRKFYFGPTEAVSSVGYDTSVSRYMVSTSDTSTNDGRLYYIDLILDPTGTL